MASTILVPFASLLAVLLMMLGESLIARRHEQQLRQRGAVEPPGDVYAMMRWAYPGAFVAMAVEGALFGQPGAPIVLAGACVLGAAKALKWWAMASLGTRWTFRVLIVPGAPLVGTGPYAVLRHPNYVAVVGELLSMALLVGAVISGPISVLLFGLLLRQRIRLEDRALRSPPST
jgi:methyltransferase